MYGSRSGYQIALFSASRAGIETCTWLYMLSNIDEAINHQNHTTVNPLIWSCWTVDYEWWLSSTYICHDLTSIPMNITIVVTGRPRTEAVHLGAYSNRQAKR